MVDVARARACSSSRRGYLKEHPPERRLHDARQLGTKGGPAADRRARAFDAWLAHAG